MCKYFQIHALSLSVSHSLLLIGEVYILYIYSYTGKSILRACIASIQVKVTQPTGSFVPSESARAFRIAREAWMRAICVFIECSMLTHTLACVLMYSV